ncbi:hypothetical protein A3D77_06620 [Candidatus Gottesmanbacteria bacterium RIFCSPHIGHO2_02_FULL_39_11]|uniref:Transcription factor zinc-finger domain-containing protein n=1 Tax=Candidatus Gottesmanbacteria bacterium RIFCSPHIGHO2_02_FULL_39_11 TaxID=1798382 RepID=A0A1F5ZTP1_9BACT|nr:MAG: hypothetical protein A3D77_06620 [Candidatus Gottesmanbacteria bacterium RIFCSPHIGHO2_02_FULL_39_11]
MICPNCQNSLYPISGETAIGTRFTLHRCGNCGGVWFDPAELESVPYHEVVRLAKMTVIRRSSSPVIRSADHELLCPLDNHPLSPLHREATPQGLALLQCAKCKGVWASTKALKHMAENLEESGKTAPGDETIFPLLSSSIAPFLVASFLCLSTLITLIVLRNSQEQRIYATQLMAGLTDIPLAPTSQFISFQTRVPVTSEISYGTSRLTIVKQKIDTKPATLHQITLRNLSGNTPYLYTLTLTDASGNSYTTPVYIFSTK